MGMGGQRHAPTALPPGKRPGTHCIGGCADPRAGLDGCGKSRPHRDSIPEPSTLYRLSYPGPLILIEWIVKGNGESLKLRKVDCVNVDRP